MNRPEEMRWEGMKLVRISDVGEAFRVWLYGQTLPVVDGNATPFDWAYYGDYVRFVDNLPVID
jgi:hypothetical protein